MKPSTIYIKDFNYELPEDRIAKYPLEKRSASKLLLYKKGTIEHRNFLELPDLLPEKSMLIFNNTKVIQARLIFKKETGADIEIFLLNPANLKNASSILETKGESVWQCMIGNKKRWKQNDRLVLKNESFELKAEWMDRENDLVRFTYGDISFQEIIQQFGNLPIPPYLNRPTELIDQTRYQTSFAISNGSVAAPTAALHFDEEINHRLFEKGIRLEYLTLHVGAGTFKPVSADNALEHIMHEEYIVFSKPFIESFLEHKHPKIAVGTTSFRSLESLYWFGVQLILKDKGTPGVGLHLGLLDHFHIPQYFPYEKDINDFSVEKSLRTILNWMNRNELQSLEGTSSIYIVPGYQPKMVQGIITNFHQPQSTLLLLIAALVGNDWKRIYEEALKNGYRFLSYGDSSLILF